ncbi:hypothetical protein C8J56DRAFT_899297 [Mycena floridula]|nr:hypothetical protein C8J56DRAFT_899297 [Mycena floridula]
MPLQCSNALLPSNFPLMLAPFVLSNAPTPTPFAGTSSKSTKPVYGGVRYLQKVFMEADWSGGSSSAKPSPSRVRHIPLCGMLPISAVLIYLLPARYRSQL